MNLPSIQSMKVYTFVVITIISVATLLGPTSNYVQVYKAVEKLNVTAAKSPITFMQNYRTLITVNVSVENPTGYSGIGIISIMFNVFYLAANGTTEQLSTGTRIWFTDEPGQLVGPHSAISKSYDLVLNLEDKRSTFAELQNLQNSGQKIEMLMENVGVDIDMFMGRIIVPAETVTLNHA